MRSYTLPARYFLLLFLIIGAMMGAIIVADTLAKQSAENGLFVLIKSPLEGTIFEQIFDTLIIVILVLVLYTIGVYAIVRKMPDEASRFTAVRIFSTFLLGLGFLLGLMVWVQDPREIVLFIGIIWGAIVVALRDLIQNVVGSLVLLVTRVYRVGDRVHVKGVYGIVMDIGIFRTTLMQLDEESGDHPSGQVTTIPNGILFRETLTNTSRDLSFAGDEIRITLPFSADIEKTKTLLIDIVQRYTREVQENARSEIKRLGERMYLPDFGTEPTVFVHIDRQQVLMVVKFYTETRRKAGIKNQIVGEISRVIPEALEVAR